MFHYRNCVRPAGQTLALALLLLPGLALLPGSANAALELDGAIRIALDNDPASAASRAWNCGARRRTLPTRSSSSMILRFSNATAAATGCPDAVNPWPQTPRRWDSSAIGRKNASLTMMAEIGI